MVSSGTVSANAEELSSTISSYTATIGELSSVWKGKSYENLNAKANDFATEFTGVIKNQMDAFATALSEYERYKVAKQNYEIAANNYNKAIQYRDNNRAPSFYYEAEKYANEINNLQERIQSLLASISSKKLTAKKISSSSTVSGAAKGKFVNYYQYNYSDPYSRGTIKTSGCGPTSLAMVLTYLTGQEVSPRETAKKGNGTYTCSQGTTWNYFGDISKQYGVNCQQMGVSQANIVDNLKSGKTLIMSMGPGHFTSKGHFIVVRGLTNDGKLIVADPNSESRSSQTWDVNTLVKEGKQIWAMST